MVEHLTKVFPRPKGESVRAVDDASFAVEDRELLVLVGPSGCGKTTTLRLIAGLEEADRGAIWMDGKVVNEVPAKDRDVAMVFQSHALYPHMSAYHNLAFGLKLRRVCRPEIERRVREAAQMLGLADCLDRLPQELSGGQRQRVALGRALVRQPRVFLLDEPLSNLDGPMRLQMRGEIGRLQARLGVTTIYVTHDQVEAMTLGHRIAVMNEGVIQQVADPMTLYRQPANLFVAGFIGTPPMNVFPGVIIEKDGALWFASQESPAGEGQSKPREPLRLRFAEEVVRSLRGHVGKEVILGLRSEAIHSPSSRPDAPPGQTVEAVVDGVERMGPETYLRMVSGSCSFIVRVPAAASVRVQEKIALAFDIERAHFFDVATEKRIA